MVPGMQCTVTVRSSKSMNNSRIRILTSPHPQMAPTPSSRQTSREETQPRHDSCEESGLLEQGSHDDDPVESRYGLSRQLLVALDVAVYTWMKTSPNFETHCYGRPENSIRPKWSKVVGHMIVVWWFKTIMDGSVSSEMRLILNMPKPWLDW